MLTSLEAGYRRRDLDATRKEVWKTREEGEQGQAQSSSAHKEACRAPLGCASCGHLSGHRLLNCGL